MINLIKCAQQNRVAAPSMLRKTTRLLFPAAGNRLAARCYLNVHVCVPRFVTAGGPSVDKLMPGDQILSINGEDVAR